MVLFIHGPVIQIAPATQNVLLIEHEDQRATFFCQAAGVSSYWSINGTTVGAHGNGYFKSKGVMFTSTPQHVESSVNVHNMTLIFPISVEFNNTEIRCVAVVHHAAWSEPVFLIIKSMCHAIVLIKLSSSHSRSHFTQH